MDYPQTDTLETVKRCCEALDGKKAIDVRVLDVVGKSSVTDYFVVATGNSEPHLRALGRELQKALQETGTSVVGSDKGAQSGWVVVDAFDFMVHLFLPEQREYYQIEALWKDAEEVDVGELMTA